MHYAFCHLPFAFIFIMCVREKVNMMGKSFECIWILFINCLKFQSRLLRTNETQVHLNEFFWRHKHFPIQGQFVPLPFLCETFSVQHFAWHSELHVVVYLLQVWYHFLFRWCVLETKWQHILNCNLLFLHDLDFIFSFLFCPSFSSHDMPHGRNRVFRSFVTSFIVSYMSMLKTASLTLLNIGFLPKLSFNSEASKAALAFNHINVWRLLLRDVFHMMSTIRQMNQKYENTIGKLTNITLFFYYALRSFHPRRNMTNQFPLQPQFCVFL